MDKKSIIAALKLVREHSKKRKFEQSIELVLNFKGIDFKKAENRIDFDVRLPHTTGKKAQIKALVFVKDSNFADEIQSKVAKVVLDNEIANIKKKEIEQLAKEYNIFLAEGQSILTVAKYLGQQLAPKGLMPKPIQASIQSLAQATRNVSASTKITNKKGKFMPVIHVMVGKEGMKDEDIADNIHEIYYAILNVLPTKEANMKSAYVKATMGPPVKLGDKPELRPSASKASAVAKPLVGVQVNSNVPSEAGE